jgi:hypothetical protein
MRFKIFCANLPGRSARPGRGSVPRNLRERIPAIASLAPYLRLPRNTAAAAIFAVSLGLGAAPLEPLVGRAHADVPFVRFNDSKLQVKTTLAAKAVNDCDPVAARRAIDELKELQKNPDKFGLAKMAVTGEPNKDLITDLLKLPDFIKLLEQEFAARCGPQILESTETGSSASSRTFGFFFANVRDLVKQQFDAVEACGQITDAIRQIKGFAQQLRDQAAERARRGAPGQQQLEADARSADQAANWLEANSEQILADVEKAKAEKAKPATTPTPTPEPSVPGGRIADPPPGQGSITPRGAPGRVIDPNRPQFLIDGAYANVNVPSFGAGTQFVAALAREVEILRSPRNLSSAGGAVEFRAPVSSVFGADVPSIFSQVAFYAKLEGSSFWGSESGSVPIGGNNVAYTYLFSNPATGTTGVLAGATGQDISIKANGEAIRFRAGAEWQASLASLRTVYAIISGGLAFDYTDSGYEITQQSLFFPDVSSRTKLRVDDYFFAPYIGAGVRFDDGNVFASLSGFVAPGGLYTDASAKQKNLCGPCPNPGDRNFKLRSSFSNTRFAVQTGVDLRIGARLTPSVAIEGGFQYVHTSHAAFLRPPTTPTEQPVSLDYGSTNRFGGRLGVRFTF